MTLKEMLPVVTELFHAQPNCQICNLHGSLACGGCPKSIDYKERYNRAIRDYGQEQLDAVLAYVAAKEDIIAKVSSLQNSANAYNLALDACKKLGIQ